MKRKKRKQKSELAKKRDNPNSSYWKRRADAAWWSAVHDLHPRCLMAHLRDCKGNLEAHHMISRSVLHSRHSILNGVILCSWHHKFSTTCSPHAAPVGFLREFRDRYPLDFERIEAMQRLPLLPTGIRMSFKACCELIEKTMKEVNGAGKLGEVQGVRTGVRKPGEPEADAGVEGFDSAT
jgi:hypothetical protein